MSLSVKRAEVMKLRCSFRSIPSNPLRDPTQNKKTTPYYVIAIIKRAEIKYCRPKRDHLVPLSVFLKFGYFFPKMTQICDIVRVCNGRSKEKRMKKVD